MLKKILICISCCLFILNNDTLAQQPLQKIISVNVQKQKLSDVLDIIGNAGNITFSYNSNIIKKDSMVTLQLVNKTIQYVLKQLFANQYEFVESGNYIIIKRIAITTKNNTLAKQKVQDKFYYITGYIIDEETGEQLKNATVYEPNQLVSDLTDNKGYFKVKLKSKYKKSTIVISKANYRDTTFMLTPTFNQHMVVAIATERKVRLAQIVTAHTDPQSDSLHTILNGTDLPTELTPNEVAIHKTWISKLFLSSKQKIQSVNVKNFFTSKPFQVSFLPSIGTQGRLSSQVTNKLSLNMLGGYSGGLNGVELAGLFNITKKHVRFLQMAGLFNTVGGKVYGVQLAGLQNLVFDSVVGVQAAGITNIVKGKFNGIQMAGIQNYNTNTMDGIQIAGISNVSKKTVKGFQIAGIVNYTKKLNGIQIGLINIADSSTGMQIGLVNIVKKGGYHTIGIGVNELNNINVDVKTGTSKLYSIIHVGANISSTNKIYTTGLGVGRKYFIKPALSFNTELLFQHIYLGNVDYTNWQQKLSINLQYKLYKGLSIYGGPSLSILKINQPAAVQGYKFTLPSTFTLNAKTTALIGYSIGLHLF